MERTKQKMRYSRHKRVRAKIFGTARVPRLCVFRSSKHIYVQVIDDEKSKTLAQASDFELKNTSNRNDRHNLKQEKKEGTPKPLTGKVAVAYKVGKLIAEKALQKKIKKVVFDRGGYKYHGRVKALAEGARKGGLKF